MMSEQEVTSEEVQRVCERLKKEAHEGGYDLNPDEEFVEDLIRGLLTNEKRYGYRACPCRLASGVREEDLEGHMENEAVEGIAPVEKNDEMEKDRRVKMLLERDNQVRHAVELLKTWSIFSQIKTAPGE